jgi:hypothetical protein
MNLGFKPLYYGAAGWTLTPGLTVQQYASTTHGHVLQPPPSTSFPIHHSLNNL